MSKPIQREKRHAALAHLDSDQEVGTTIIGECTGFTYLDLRGDSESPGFCQIVQQTLRLALPTTPNTRTHNNDGTMSLWLGPDQWFVLIPGYDNENFESRIHASNFQELAVTNVSSGFTMLSLQGDGASETIRRSTPYDLQKLELNRCTQTVFAKTQVLMWRQNHNDYRLVVRRSLADYLHQWLCDAARE